jgi:hypothetical protein
MPEEEIYRGYFARREDDPQTQAAHNHYAPATDAAILTALLEAERTDALIQLEEVEATADELPEAAREAAKLHARAFYNARIYQLARIARQVRLT